MTTIRDPFKPKMTWASARNWLSLLAKKVWAWLLVAAGGTFAVWYNKDQVEAAIERVTTWMGQSSNLQNWAALAAVSLLVGHAVFGLFAIWARIRDLRPWVASRIFQKGIFKSTCWSWGYSAKGSPIDLAVCCPFDDTDMSIRDEEDGRSRGVFMFVCPTCNRSCSVGLQQWNGAAKMIEAEIRTGRWKDHHATYLDRRATLVEAIGHLPVWHGSLDKSLNRSLRDKEANHRKEAPAGPASSNQ